MNNKVLYIALGAAVGGLVGYLVGDLVAYKVLQKTFYNAFDEMERDEEIEEGINVVPFDMKDESFKSDTRRKVDYSNNAKRPLEELVAPYKSENLERVRIISRETFEGDVLDRVRVEIAYYEEDAVYANSEDVAFEPTGDLLSVNAHLHFGEDEEDPDVVFIRNDNLGFDYILTRIHGSYKTIVLGEEEPPKTSGKRRRHAAKPQVPEVEDEEDDEDA